MSDREGDPGSEEWLGRQFRLSLGSIRPPRLDPAGALYNTHRPRARTALVLRVALGVAAAAVATGATLVGTEATGSPSPAVWVGDVVQRCGQGQCLGAIASGGGGQGGERPAAPPTGDPAAAAPPPQGGTSPPDQRNGPPRKTGGAPGGGQGSSSGHGAVPAGGPPAGHGQGGHGSGHDASPAP